MEIRDTDPRSSVEAGRLYSNMADFFSHDVRWSEVGSDWLEFVVAILDLENNTIYCCPNNILLSFGTWLTTAPMSVQLLLGVASKSN